LDFNNSLTGAQPPRMSHWCVKDTSSSCCLLLVLLLLLLFVVCCLLFVGCYCCCCCCCCCCCLLLSLYLSVTLSLSYPQKYSDGYHVRCISGAVVGQNRSIHHSDDISLLQSRAKVSTAPTLLFVCVLLLLLCFVCVCDAASLSLPLNIYLR